MPDEDRRLPPVKVHDDFEIVEIVEIVEPVDKLIVVDRSVMPGRTMGLYGTWEEARQAMEFRAVEPAGGLCLAAWPTS
jgi:hypothetical protein